MYVHICTHKHLQPTAITAVEEKLAYFSLMDTCLQSESFNGHTQLDLWPFLQQGGEKYQKDQATYTT